jgi:hypothetical protein
VETSREPPKREGQSPKALYSGTRQEEMCY